LSENLGNTQEELQVHEPLLPLTPALSLGERERRIQVLKKPSAF